MSFEPSSAAAFFTVRVGCGSVKLAAGRGLTICGALTPFWDAMGGDAGVPTLVLSPDEVPTLGVGAEGSVGDSSLHPIESAKTTTVAKTLGVEVRSDAS